MRPVMVKVYGFLYPACPELITELNAIIAPLMGDVPSVFTLSDSLLNISFEGDFFPEQDVLNCLIQNLTTASRGKLDYIDMEAWELIRHEFSGSAVTSGKRSLNNVLEYSGH